MKTLTKAISIAAILAVAGLFGVASPAQAETVCTPVPNGSQTCYDNGQGSGIGGSNSGNAGGAPVGNVPGAVPPPPPAPVKQAPVPVPVPVPVQPAPAPVKQAPAPAPALVKQAPAPIQNVTPVTVTPVVPSQNATDANATEDVKLPESAPSPISTPSTVSQEQTVIEPTPTVSSPSPVQSPPAAIPLAELSETKVSSSSPNLSVLIGASLIVALLFGVTMFRSISFKRHFVKEFQSGQDS